jgi:hypothetical protein
MMSGIPLEIFIIINQQNHKNLLALYYDKLKRRYIR